MGATNEDRVSAAGFGEWNRHIATALLHVGETTFPAALITAIRAITPFKYAVIIIYRPKAPPRCIHHTFKGDAANRAVRRFEEATYVLNPVYNAFLNGLGSGVYRITELAPDAYFTPEDIRSLAMRERDDEELGYRTPGWPAGLAELIIAITLPDGAMAEISLSRPAGEGYEAACLARMRLVEPLIATLFALHWAKVRPGLGQPGASLSLDELLRDFGRDMLTAREREVAQLILRGHSGESIALQLGISQATVKTHRQNLYAKLSVATQQELFSHFLRSLPLAG